MSATMIENALPRLRGGMAGAYLTGSPYAQGFQHGRAFTDEIVYNLHMLEQGRRDLAAAGRDYPYDDIVHAAHRFAVEVRPDIEDELVGIARGADVPLEDILHHNFPAYVLATLLSECTQVLVGPERTDDGQVRLAKTRDTRGDTMRNVALHRLMPDGMEILEVTHAGSITLTGSAVNSSGLMFSTSGVWGPRVTLPFEEAGQCWLAADVGGVIRSATTVEEFQEQLGQQPRMANLNLACADAQGSLAALEVSRDAIYRVDAEDGYTVRTNHFLHPDLQGLGPQRHEYESTYLRHETASAMIEAGPVSQERLWEIVSSHEHAPDNTICRHGSGQGASETTYAGITTWPEMSLDAWGGYPCTRVAS